MPQERNQTAEELLRELLNRTSPKLDPEKLPPTPTSMLPQPATVGRPEFLHVVKEVIDKYPELRRSVSQFRQGPTEGSMNAMANYSNLPIDSFEGTTLQGVFDEGDKAIGINPLLRGVDLKGTLIHESAHSQGADEPGARLAKLLFQRANPDEMTTSSLLPIKKQ